MSTSTRILRIVVPTLAGVLLLPGPSRVSAQEPLLKIVLPFEFTVGATTLPRDTYEVTRLATDPDVLVLRSERHQVVVIGQSGTMDGFAQSMPSLVFDRYGNEYFLREARFGEGIEMSLPKTSQEREAVMKRASAARPDVVVVAAETR